jgi:hypothetical protein
MSVNSVGNFTYKTNYLYYHVYSFSFDGWFAGYSRVSRGCTFRLDLTERPRLVEFCKWISTLWGSEKYLYGAARDAIAINAVYDDSVIVSNERPRTYGLLKPSKAHFKVYSPPETSIKHIMSIISHVFCNLSAA